MYVHKKSVVIITSLKYNVSQLKGCFLWAATEYTTRTSRAKGNPKKTTFHTRDWLKENHSL